MSNPFTQGLDLTSVLADPRTPPGMRAAAVAAMQARQPQGGQQAPPPPMAPPAPPADVTGPILTGAALADRLQQPAARAMARGGRVEGYAGGGGVRPTKLNGTISPMLLALTKQYMAQEDDEDGPPMGLGGYRGAGVGDEELTGEDKGLALAQAGFGMAASNSPHFGQALGEGGMYGIQALQNLRKERALNAMKNAQLESIDAYRAAQIAAKAEPKGTAFQQGRAFKTPGGKTVQARFNPDTGGFEIQDDKGGWGSLPPGSEPTTTGQDFREDDVQQSGAFQLESGDIVQGRFNKATKDYEYKGPDGKYIPLPPTARPTTPGAGGPLSRKQYNTDKLAFNDEVQGLKKIDAYMGTVQDASQGIELVADKVARAANTMFQQPLSKEQLAAVKSGAQLQALLGSFRTDIVGPGVMTEYDAQRVLQALGGDATLLRDKELVRSVLTDMLAAKRQRTELMRSNLMGSAATYGDTIDSFVIPDPANLKPKAAPGAPGAAPSTRTEYVRDAKGRLVPK